MPEAHLKRYQLYVSEELMTALDIIATERELTRSEVIEQLCWADQAVEQIALDNDIPVNPARPKPGRRWPRSE